MRRKRKRDLEVKVWREPGFADGEADSWRAQIYADREVIMSAIGAGRTRQEAIDDCVTRHRAYEEMRARDAATVEWLPL